jgi:hypothetical protein
MARRMPRACALRLPSSRYTQQPGSSRKLSRPHLFSRPHLRLGAYSAPALWQSAAILQTVGEFAPEQVSQLAKLKMADLAREAERLVAGTGWIPALFQDVGSGHAPSPFASRPLRGAKGTVPTRR